MADDMVDRKLERAFAQIDFDGSGEIEREDLLGLGSRLLAAFGEPPTSPKGTAVTDGMVRFWTELAATADSDGDGRITAKEYVVGMRNAFIESPDGFARAFRPMVQAVALLFDTDGDGSISLAEFRKGTQVIGTPPAEVDEAFDALDLDGDGTLSVDELVEGARQFYIGTDPDAPGNLLFGSL